MQTAPVTVAPDARNSAPMACPTRCSSAGSNDAPRAIDTGNVVAGPITQPRGPSAKSSPGMPSRSTWAAGQGWALYPPPTRSANPGQTGTSPSRQPSFSSRVISSTRPAASTRASAPAATQSAAHSNAVTAPR